MSLMMRAEEDMVVGSKGGAREQDREEEQKSVDDVDSWQDSLRVTAAAPVAAPPAFRGHSIVVGQSGTDVTDERLRRKNVHGCAPQPWERAKRMDKIQLLGERLDVV